MEYRLAPYRVLNLLSTNYPCNNNDNKFNTFRAATSDFTCRPILVSSCLGMVGFFRQRCCGFTAFNCLLFVAKKRLKAKRAALKLFVKPITPHTPSSAIELLRQAALCYYPREAIASLHGEQWYQFLDLQLGETRFSDKMPLWQAALYQNKHGEHDNELVNDCLVWVEKALPPKRGMCG